MVGVTAPYTWEELRALSLARQFPAEPLPVADLAGAIGPIQTQIARSAHLGLVARNPALTREEITAGYESGRLVRGSTLRGTVHTTTAHLHPYTDAVTRVGQRTMWQRVLPLTRHSPVEVWGALEAATADRWLTPDELSAVLVDWLASEEPGLQPRWPSVSAGRYFAFGHGGLVRRPAAEGASWSGQTAPVYRALDAAVPQVGAHRATVLADPELATRGLVANHLRWYGPATRQDIAWWSGLGLRAVDAALAALAPVLTTRPGPYGRDHHDLAEPLPAPVVRRGIDLLPEFDAVFCGYHPDARDRFARPEHAAVLWGASNGLTLAPMLRDGQVAGWWRATGSGARRDVEIAVLHGRLPARRAFDQPLAGVAEALGITVSRVELRRA